MSMKFMLARLSPNCDRLFKRPGPVWYTVQALRKSTVASMMKNISGQAECSKVYTNHSVQAMTVTALHEAGISDHQIMAVTGHRNAASLQSYQRPNTDGKISMS